MQFRETILLVSAIAGLGLGIVANALGAGGIAQICWSIATLTVLAGLAAEIAQALRRGDFGLDLVAALSMTAALLVGESLAANVVALMYAGGQMLERFAEGRARAEMTALLGRVPRTAMRRAASGLETVAIDLIAPGDVVVVRKGEMVPVDGRLAPDHSATLDTSSLTGESLPRAVEPSGDVLSGSVCSDRSFDMIVLRPAAESTYAGIVRLVEQAQAGKAPMSRLADRYALGFLVATVVIAGIAWLMSGLPARAVAVLVVATPCPLILAVPVALMSGVSRAAKHGVLLKSAAVLERMASVVTLIVDKTGTLTLGRARVTHIEAAGTESADEMLRLAASLDQASTHVLATSLIEAARQRSLALSSPSETTEEPGAGVAGTVDGRRVAIGGHGFVMRQLSDGATPAASPTSHSSVIAVGIDDRFAGEIFMEDPLRTDAAGTIDALRQLGVRRIVLASGDQKDVTDRLAAALKIDEVHAQLDPAAKAVLVAAERSNGPLMMVGDGVNDAPALAAADVGVAMGARGSAASTEAADAVILVDDLRPLAKGIAIAQRTLHIALQSVWVGLGLSLVGMIVAAFGYLPPVQGALLQEAIDVAVIFNALRALR
jgi:heavy metal translocating P-type ATPase